MFTHCLQHEWVTGEQGVANTVIIFSDMVKVRKMNACHIGHYKVKAWTYWMVGIAILITYITFKTRKET